VFAACIAARLGLLACPRACRCLYRWLQHGNPSGHADQDVYIKALLATGSIDHVEYGAYVARVKTAPLAVNDPQGRPRLVGPDWPSDPVIVP